MNTIIKPNDIVDQILAIAAELMPVAKLCGVPEPWAYMLSERTPRAADRAWWALTPPASQYAATLRFVAHSASKALTPARSITQLERDKQEVRDARASLEPLLAELRASLEPLLAELQKVTT